MKIVKVSVESECPKCPTAKELGKRLQNKELSVQCFDLGTAEGLSETVMNQIMATPSILIEDESERVIRNWRGMVPPETEVLNALG
ncbi:MAG TPA: hypothetical protein DDZ40_09525 [Deltaproteobacteria bacterium]|nr:hypothetical protein [Deltaproteobacteria bacterium]